MMRFVKLMILFIIFNKTTVAQINGHNGAKTPTNQCIKNSQYQIINSLKSEGIKTGYLRDVILLDDPMGDGGINSFGKTVTNYVDHNPTGSLLDYSCGQVTYNSHQGTDIEILNFYEMDEGIPILSSTSGIVTYAHDGEYDRHIEWINDVYANAVIVSHSDGSEVWYWHMRKNSVNVELGDAVAAGDTLGYVGSSGYSSGPHIHFEIQQNETVDPFTGNCQNDTSHWIEQGDYVLSLPFEVMDHGLTTIPLDWAMISERPPTKFHVTTLGTIYSWLRLRNVQDTDQITWEFYANGALWDSYSFNSNNTYSSSWWYVYCNLPSSSIYYGNWELKIYRNDSLIVEQTFLYDDVSNQVPLIENMVIDLEMNSSVNGEFLAIDPDGSIFWYEIVTGPSNGSLSQYGGRKRKYNYTSNEGFFGQDTVFFYATDDENIAGENGMYIFNVLENLIINEVLGCTDTTACNYNASANSDNGTCTYIDEILHCGCTSNPVGDFNLDCQTDILDVVDLVEMVIHQTLFTEQELMLCDMNNDNIINVVDLVMLVSFIIGALF